MPTTPSSSTVWINSLQHAATRELRHCNTLQHDVTRHNTLQHTYEIRRSQMPTTPSSSTIWFKAILCGSAASGLTHVTHMNESCPTYEGVMSHIWRSHVTHMKESCHTYEGVMSHLWRSHIAHMKRSSHTSDVTHTIESCHTYKWVMSHV